MRIQRGYITQVELWTLLPKNLEGQAFLSLLARLIYLPFRFR
jgi:hypothetical protein